MIFKIIGFILKPILYFLLILIIIGGLLWLGIGNAFGVTIVENSPQNPLNETGEERFQGIGVAILIGVLVGVGVGGIIWLIWWIVKKIKENKRKHTDLLYSKFLIDLKNCHQNRDYSLKKRNAKTFFLTYKRADIMLNTREKGIKYFGKYDGELLVKDNFVMIGVHRTTGVWTREKDIIIIPFELRNRVRKERYGKSDVMTIYGEGIDEVMNTDYYNEVIFYDESKKDKLISFTDYINKTFLENYVYRQVIKDNLLDYKESLDKIVELNPNIQVDRKNPRQ